MLESLSHCILTNLTGSSILFVIVAQDITLGGSTPVTQEYLWIFKLSFGSKIFVVISLVYSLLMLKVWAFFEHTYRDIKDSNEGKLFVSKERISLTSGRDLLQDTGTMETLTALSTQSSPVGDEEQNVIVNEDESSSVDSAESVSVGPQQQQSFFHRILPKLLLDFFGYIPNDKPRKRIRKLQFIDVCVGLFCMAMYSLFLCIMFTAGFSKESDD